MKQGKFVLFLAIYSGIWLQAWLHSSYVNTVRGVPTASTQVPVWDKAMHCVYQTNHNYWNGLHSLLQQLHTMANLGCMEYYYCLI